MIFCGIVRRGIDLKVLESRSPIGLANRTRFEGQLRICCRFLVPLDQFQWFLPLVSIAVGVI